MWSLLSARMALTKPAASEMEGSSSTVVALGDGLHDESKFSEQEFSDHAIKSSRQKKTVTLFQAIPLDVLFEVKKHHSSGFCQPMLISNHSSDFFASHS